MSDEDDLNRNLTLALMWLNSYGGRRFGARSILADDCYNVRVLNELRERGYLRVASRTVSRHKGKMQAKVTYSFSSEGMTHAEIFLRYFMGANHLMANVVEGAGAPGQAVLDYERKAGTAFRLRVELDLEDMHPCWRELVLPAYCTFADLHEAIQGAFLWMDEHLHDFRLRTGGEDVMLLDANQLHDQERYGTLDDRYHCMDEMGKCLGDVFPRTRKVAYLYDYGDYWEHKISLVEVLREGDVDTVRCVDGEGDAPPEDVGGSYGFERFLEALADPGNADHDDTAKFAKGQLYEPFSLQAVQERMRRWETGELFKDWDRIHEW